MLQIILWSYFDLWPQCNNKWQSGQMATIRSSSKIVGDKPTDFIGDNMVKQKIQESSLLYLNLLWPAIWDTIFFLTILWLFCRFFRLPASSTNVVRFCMILANETKIIILTFWSQILKLYVREKNLKMSCFEQTLCSWHSQFSSIWECKR